MRCRLLVWSAALALILSAAPARAAHLVWSGLIIAQNEELETNTKLSHSSPLVIKGPQVGGGQLLLVLEIDDDMKNESSENRQHHRGHRSANKIEGAWHRFTRFFQKR